MENNTLNIDTLDAFTRAYMECALWSSSGDNGVEFAESHEITDLSPEAWQKMVDDCAKFQADNAKVLDRLYTRHEDNGYKYDAQRAGHDFWLTRNGHGAGFWDRGLGKLGDYMASRCGWQTPYPELNLYLDDNGKIGIE